MSENLAKLAHKIDFASQNEDEAEAAQREAPDSDDKEVNSFQQPQWPWESVRNKIRSGNNSDIITDNTWYICV